MTNTTFLMVHGNKSEVDFTWSGRQGPGGTIDATVTFVTGADRSGTLYRRCSYSPRVNARL
jgi:hypothetical protein